MKKFMLSVALAVAALALPALSMAQTHRTVVVHHPVHHPVHHRGHPPVHHRVVHHRPPPHRVVHHTPVVHHR